MMGSGPITWTINALAYELVDGGLGPVSSVRMADVPGAAVTAFVGLKIGIAQAADMQPRVLRSGVPDFLPAGTRTFVLAARPTSRACLPAMVAFFLGADVRGEGHGVRLHLGVRPLTCKSVMAFLLHLLQP